MQLDHRDRPPGLRHRHHHATPGHTGRGRRDHGVLLHHRQTHAAQAAAHRHAGGGFDLVVFTQGTQLGRVVACRHHLPHRQVACAEAVGQRGRHRVQRLVQGGRLGHTPRHLVEQVEVHRRALHGRRRAGCGFVHGHGIAGGSSALGDTPQTHGTRQRHHSRERQPACQVGTGRQRQASRQHGKAQQQTGSQQHGHDRNRGDIDTTRVWQKPRCGFLGLPSGFRQEHNSLELRRPAVRSRVVSPYNHFNDARAALRVGTACHAGCSGCRGLGIAPATRAT